MVLPLLSKMRVKERLMAKTKSRHHVAFENFSPFFPLVNSISLLALSIHSSLSSSAAATEPEYRLASQFAASKEQHHEGQGKWCCYFTTRPQTNMETFWNHCHLTHHTHVVSTICIYTTCSRILFAVHFLYLSPIFLIIKMIKSTQPTFDSIKSWHNVEEPWVFEKGS